jgi:hypothetical protein
VRGHQRVLCLKDELGSKIELEYSMTLSTNWGNDYLNEYAAQINTLEAQAKKTGAPASYDKALEDQFNNIKAQILGSSNGCGGKSGSGGCGTTAGSGKTGSGTKTGSSCTAGSSSDSSGKNVLTTTPPQSPTSGGTSVDPSIQAEIDNMDKAFLAAIAAQMKITSAKTIDDSQLDASKQRPSG